MPKAGYKQTEAHRMAHLEKIKGKNNGNWKGGIWTSNMILYQREKSREWVVNNRDKKRHKDLMYIYRKKNAEGNFTLEEWEKLTRESGGKCVVCEEVRPLTRDHIIPLSRGGTNYIQNIQPLCRPCNSRKSSKIEGWQTSLKTASAMTSR